MTKIDRFRGCVLAGACGDALGNHLEFLNRELIDRHYGPRPLETVRTRYPVLDITDDTQMTLFTLEGLLGNSRPLQVDKVLLSYHRWLYTQNRQITNRSQSVYRDLSSVAFGALLAGSPLVKEPNLYKIQAPGNTCLTALETGLLLTPDQTANNSKGCGTVMRMAPLAFFFSDPDELYSHAVDLSALTHGHPTGQAAAGALVVLLHYLLEDQDLPAALDLTLEFLRRQPHTSETVAALEAARKLAARQEPQADFAPVLGGGWIAEECLAIAVYAVLVGRDAEQALEVAICHSGDSDSTGAVCGNLLGCWRGAQALEPLLSSVNLDCRDILETLIQRAEQDPGFLK